MIITKKIDDLNTVEYGFSLYCSFSDEVSIYFDFYRELTRKSKRHGWVANGRWTRLDRRNSSIKTMPGVPRDIYKELVSLIRFNPKFDHED